MHTHITATLMSESTPWTNRSYPSPDPLCYGRKSACCVAGDRIVVAVQVSRGKQETIAAIWRSVDEAGLSKATAAVLPQGTGRYQPVLVEMNGEVIVAWNEWTGGFWAVRWAPLCLDDARFGEVRTVHEGPGMCTAPALTAHGGTAWALWSMRDDGFYRVHASPLSEGLRSPMPVSPEGVDAFRPAIASDGARLIAAWDEGARADRALVIARCDAGGKNWCEIARFARDGERNLGQRMVSSSDGEVYLCWLVQRTVVDDALGIVDHWPIVRVVRVSGTEVTELVDRQNRTDERIAADLREGQLAEEDYLCYQGLRQNPQLAIGTDGTPWLAWEQRVEREAKDRAGRLMARRWFTNASGETGWGRIEALIDGGFGYSVAPRFTDTRLAAAWFRPDAGGLEFVATRAVEPAGVGRPVATAGPVNGGAARWNRWRLSAISPPEKPSETIIHDNGTYRVYWADTHCHSNLCPDAEGDPDDLIRFARDIAGLDAVCLVDNGWYPPKGLTTPEWGLHQALADHYTRNGEFVVFPGYEYSWHRKDATPIHRHRTVLFPRSGGPLLRRIDADTRDPRALFERLEGTGGISYLHHCEFDVEDPRFDTNTEVCSSWRICIEENDCTYRRLRAGHRLGFIGSSDSHRMVPGLGGALTGILATELTPEALFDAYRNRRLIATSGHFVFMDIRVAGALPGQATESEGPVTIELNMRAPAVIESVRVLRDAEPVWEWHPRTTRLAETWTDREARGGVHSYFVRVKLAGDPSFNCPDAPGRTLPRPFDWSGPYRHNLARARGVFAWSSPTWVNLM
jgi:hypothetical protein